MAEPIARLWQGRTTLILASGSRTRADLLRSAGLVIETICSGIDERAVENAAGNISPVDLAIRLAEAKAHDVARRNPDRIVVGADQVLEIDGAVVHKAASSGEARAHLTRLQGRTHELHSALAIVHDGRVETFHETARLTMRPLRSESIDAYVAIAGDDRLTSSVGGYQLEGLGIHLFDRIEGDHSTVLGLPLIPLLRRLRAMGLLAIA